MKDNKRMMKTSQHFSPVPESLLRTYEPKQTWLAHDSYYHGVDHMARVFILQELICDMLEARNVEVNREALRWASSLHDVGRLDDGIDREHGTRSAQWIKENLSHKMSPEVLDLATYIVHWHVPSDVEAPVMTTELQVLKDADALDRARLGDLDVRYLRTEASKSLVEVAENLFRSYEALDIDDPFEAVVRAGKLVGVVQPDEED